MNLPPRVRIVCLNAYGILRKQNVIGEIIVGNDIVAICET